MFEPFLKLCVLYQRIWFWPPLPWARTDLASLFSFMVSHPSCCSGLGFKGMLFPAVVGLTPFIWQCHKTFYVLLQISNNKNHLIHRWCVLTSERIMGIRPFFSLLFTSSYSDLKHSAINRPFWLLQLKICIMSSANSGTDECRSQGLCSLLL